MLGDASWPPTAERRDRSRRPRRPPAAGRGRTRWTSWRPTARGAYRALVWDDPAFERGLRRGDADRGDLRPPARLAAGAPGRAPAERPARGAADAVASPTLRAIPWVFAWTQVRAQPARLVRAGQRRCDASRRPTATPALARLAALYAGWPFFRVLLQNAEVALARTRPAGAAALRGARRGADGVAARGGASPPSTRARCGPSCAITGRAALLDGVPELQRSIELRAPVPRSAQRAPGPPAGPARAACRRGRPARAELERLVGPHDQRDRGRRPGDRVGAGGHAGRRRQAAGSACAAGRPRDRLARRRDDRYPTSAMTPRRPARHPRPPLPADDADALRARPRRAGRPLGRGDGRAPR